MIFDLAVCYEKLGKNKAAIETYERYIRATKKSDPAAAARAKDSVQRLKKQ